MGLINEDVVETQVRETGTRNKPKRKNGRTLHTFVFDGHVSDDHEMSSALAGEVVLGALCQLPGVFVPRNNCVVEGHLAFEGGRLALVDLHVVDAFGEMNLFGYNR